MNTTEWKTVKVFNSDQEALQALTELFYHAFINNMVRNVTWTKLFLKNGRMLALTGLSIKLE